MIATQTGCCGARCRHCDEWRAIETIRHAIEPATRWCPTCRATCYLDEKGQCASCKEE